jgi:hypothetical protein
MILSLLVAAAVFGYLAVDAWRMGRPLQHDAPYAIEAKERGESVVGVPVREQLWRKAWHRRYGLGKPSQVVWVWAILAIGCLLAAGLRWIE